MVVEQVMKSTGRQLLRQMLNLAQTALLIALGLIPAVVYGDAPGRVGRDEKAYAQISQWASALLWVSLFPYLIWRASLSLDPAIAWGFLVTIPCAWFWFGRRISAHMAQEMTVREFAAQLRVVTENTWARTLLIAGVAISAFGVFLGLLPHWPIAVTASQGVFDGLTWYPLVTLAGYWLTLPVAARAGYLSAKDSGEDADLISYWTAQLSAVLGISQNEFLLAQTKIAFDKDGAITASDLPPSARLKFSGMSHGRRPSRRATQFAQSTGAASCSRPSIRSQMSWPRARPKLAATV